MYIQHWINIRAKLQQGALFNQHTVNQNTTVNAPCQSSKGKIQLHGPDRTRTDFVGDPHGPNGVSRRPGPQKSLCGSGRARVVKFSLSPTKSADFVWSGPVGPVWWNLAITLLHHRCLHLTVIEEVHVIQVVEYVGERGSSSGIAHHASSSNVPHGLWTAQRARQQALGMLTCTSNV